MPDIKVKSAGPDNVTGYRSFELGGYRFRRDEYFAHIACPKGSHVMPVDMFLRADSRLLLVVLIGLATIVAPVTEELVFRAGLFRYFRTRLPRWLAFLLPAVLFAALHVDNWKTLEGFASFAPLVALAVFFSAAYERTGRIGTSIVAHALFNLNTVLLIFAGVT